MKCFGRLTLFTIALFLSVAAGVAQAQRIRATLTGSEEVPVVATPARGDFRGLIQRGDQSIDYELTYSGLQGTVTQAHIHIAQPGVNGGIVIWICESASNRAPAIPGIPAPPPCTSDSGTFVGTIAAENVLAVSAQQIVPGDLASVIAAIRAGHAYVNVHTNLSPGGEIRGQIRRQR